MAKNYVGFSLALLVCVPACIFDWYIFCINKFVKGCPDGSTMDVFYFLEGLTLCFESNAVHLRKIQLGPLLPIPVGLHLILLLGLLYVYQREYFVRVSTNHV